MRTSRRPRSGRRTQRSGHLPVELGRAAEDDLNVLLEHLGFNILRKRTDFPSIDFVADFKGIPRLDEMFGDRRISLQPPVFSSSGICAFSVKRSSISQGDVSELLHKIEEAQHSHDSVMRSIRCPIVVTNQFMTEGELDDIQLRGVYCWDIRRLCFYATKTMIALRLSETGAVTETMLSPEFKTSFLLVPMRHISPAILLVKVALFVDDHRANLGHNDVTRMLEEVYLSRLKPIVESTGCQIQVQISLHVLGRVDPDLALSAYVSVGSEIQAHPDVTFASRPTFEVYQYASAPWGPIVRTP